MFSSKFLLVILALIALASTSAVDLGHNNVRALKKGKVPAPADDDTPPVPVPPPPTEAPVPPPTQPNPTQPLTSAHQPLPTMT